VAYYCRGSSYFELGKYAPAIEDFTKALTLSKTKSEKTMNLISLASTYYQAKDLEKDKLYYRKAIKLEPKLRRHPEILNEYEYTIHPMMEKTISEMMSSEL
jgi:tetratricopeptide (TPR) repeat protein